jgi:hypothetical protein
MKTALMLAAMSLWSLSSLAMNPPLDVDTLTSVMEKVKAKQEKKPVPCVCQDGSGGSRVGRDGELGAGQLQEAAGTSSFQGTGCLRFP